MEGGGKLRGEVRVDASCSIVCAQIVASHMRNAMASLIRITNSTVGNGFEMGQTDAQKYGREEGEPDL
jgi:hypothetical protein